MVQSCLWCSTGHGASLDFFFPCGSCHLPPCMRTANIRMVGRCSDLTYVDLTEIRVPTCSLSLRCPARVYSCSISRNWPPSHDGGVEVFFALVQVPALSPLGLGICIHRRVSTRARKKNTRLAGQPCFDNDTSVPELFPPEASSSSLAGVIVIQLSSQHRAWAPAKGSKSLVGSGALGTKNEQ